MAAKRRISRIAWSLVALWALFGVWTLWGWLAVNGIERPAYQVLERRDGYEVRQYSAYTVAQVLVSGPYGTAIANGSRVLAGYIRGGNATQASVARSQFIALTAPVIEESREDAWLVSLVLPSRFTADTVPRPTDPRVRLVQVPAQKAAVLAFSGWVDQAAAAEKERGLAALLARDKEIVLGPARLVQYHAPWAPPFLDRNELAVTIR